MSNVISIMDRLDPVKDILECEDNGVTAQVFGDPKTGQAGITLCNSEGEAITFKFTRQNAVLLARALIGLLGGRLPTKNVS